MEGWDVNGERAKQRRREVAVAICVGAGCLGLLAVAALAVGVVWVFAP